MPQATACSHLTHCPDLEVVFVSDTHLSIAQAFIRCVVCDQHYLIELVDLATGTSAFRISKLPAAVVAATVRSLHNGSCDVNRADAELSFVRQSAEPLPGVLMRQEGREDRIVWRYVADVGPAEVPREAWRSLPCDGSLIKSLNGNS